MMRFRAGDRKAFSELVHRNTPKVHALIYRFLGDADQLDDLTQEVFLRVYRTASRYEPTAKFSTWLYRITANLSFNVLRDRKKSSPRQLDGASGDPESAGRDIPDDRLHPPHHPLDAAELREKVSQAIASLPENQRVAIVLKKYEGKGYDEIAQVLDVSRMAVKSLLSRARENLRQSLSGYLHRG